MARSTSHHNDEDEARKEELTFCWRRLREGDGRSSVVLDEEVRESGGSCYTESAYFFVVGKVEFTQDATPLVMFHLVARRTPIEMLFTSSGYERQDAGVMSTFFVDRKSNGNGNPKFWIHWDPDTCSFMFQKEAYAEYTFLVCSNSKGAHSCCVWKMI